jgi:tetratricopeptide (TPR) repeat protein
LPRTGIDLLSSATSKHAIDGIPGTGPGDLALLTAEADAAMGREDWDAANALWHEIRERFPDDPRAFGIGPISLLRSGRPDEVEALLLAALPRFPCDVQVSFRHAEVPIFREDWPEAARRLTRHCASFPNDPNAFFELGRVSAKLMRLDEAEAAYARAAALDPGRVDAVVARQHLVDARLEPSAALEAWAAICDRHRASFWAHEGAIVAALRRGDFETADLIYDEALERFGRTPELVGASLEILVHRVRAGHRGGGAQLRLLECLREPPPEDQALYVPRLLWRLADFRRLEKPVHRAIGKVAEAALARAEALGVPDVNLDLLRCYYNIEPPGGDLAALKMAYLLKLHRFRTHFVYQGYYSDLDREIVRTWIRSAIESGGIARLDEHDLYKLLLVALSLDGHACASFCRAVDQAWAGTPADPRTVLGTVLHAVRQRAAADARILAGAGLPAPRPLRRRLSVALCISGQLRGYDRAFASWAPLGLDGHDVTRFVHVWRKVGRKFPSHGMEHEVFEGAFMEAYRKEQGRLGLAALRALYPGFIRFFSGERYVSADDMKAFYGTDHVVVEDEAAGPLAGQPNMAKMYYKAQACFQMATSSGQGFDLFVRIRPDFHVRKVTGWDWHQVRELCRAERVIVAERVPLFGNLANYQMADQFAVGEYDTMSVFTSAYGLTRHAKALGLYGYPQRFVIHDNFGWATLCGGIRVVGAGPIGMNYGLPFDLDRLDGPRIRALLLQDMGGAARNETDRRLLDALDADAVTASGRRS